MNILSVDTSGPVAGCALMIDGKIAHLCAMERGHTHSETIMPAIDEALEQNGLTCSDIDVFAAVAGPGSFTGVRIGICAVKGLAHAVQKPCAAIHALEALSLNLAGFSGLVCPILDARRSQVYCAAFDVSDGVPVRRLDDDAIDIGEFISRLPGDTRLAFVGDGVPVNAARIRELLGARAFIPNANQLSLRADAACVLADMRRDMWMSAERLAPVYLRAPQAERERLARQS